MFGTRTVEVDANAPDSRAIEEAAQILREGGLVAFPTETVYGLGANAMNPAAVADVFRVKGRQTDNPLIVHIAEKGQLAELSRSVTPLAWKLADAYFPGPLTLVVDAKPEIPRSVTGGLSTVAVRMPNHQVALELIRSLRSPIVGPSANKSGRPSPTTAEHVAEDLGGEIDLILDAGPTSIGVESTVVDVTGTEPVILRLGGLPREAIEKIAGPARRATSADELKHSPGTRYRHYAPRARVVLVPEGDTDLFKRLWVNVGSDDTGAGCIVHSPAFAQIAGDRVSSIVVRPEEYPHELFASLRALDTMGVAVILVEAIPETGVGAAVMDRLRRAAE
ncbi:MAG TPA: L-threonylcarbamoyladenylate synthase [Bacteroidota bacterium]|nr:L-threonylcarbamoyladenylate synthase [Bacteroidota bacterium]